MKPISARRASGFTLLETVIAIGVLAVLLTGFIIVFTPAAEGIRRSINIDQADRMATTFEQELSNLRVPNGTLNGFDQAFGWVKNSSTPGTALLVYQYRGNTATLRVDGTATPVAAVAGDLPGRNYTIIPMLRRNGDTLLTADLAAVEGAVYLVKCTQLILNTTGELAGNLTLGTPGTIKGLDGNTYTSASGPPRYPEALLTYKADFYQMPEKTAAYLSGPAFTAKFNSSVKNPVFSRNLAAR